MDDFIMMNRALQKALDAERNGEVPVGAVIVNSSGEVISNAGNQTESLRDATAHAEMIAIRKACHLLRSRRLSGCTIYVTMEPCPMCAGAIVSSRIKRVVYGTKDPRAGAFGSLIDLSKLPLESRPSVTSGVLAEECLEPLQRMFSKKRNS